MCCSAWILNSSISSRSKGVFLFTNMEGSWEGAHTVTIRLGPGSKQPTQSVSCCIWPSLLVLQALPGAPKTCPRSCRGASTYHRCLFVLDVQGTALTPKLLYCALLAFFEGKMNNKKKREKNKNGNVYFTNSSGQKEGWTSKNEPGRKPYWWKEWAFVKITTAFQAVSHSQKTFNVPSTHFRSFHIHPLACHVVCIKSGAATSAEREGCGFNVLYTIHSRCSAINKRGRLL